METDRERAPATMSTHLSVDSGAFSPTSQEIDFNQTQLRLVREQTSHCIRDLNALRAEVMLLKSEVESDRLSASAAASSMEGKQIDVQEHFERERRERDAVLQQLSRKVQDLDRELPPIRDEMSLVREQIRALETAWHPHIEDLQATFLKDVEARHQAHGQLEQRLAEIDAGMAKHSALHKDLRDRLQTTVHQEHLEKLGREIQTHVAKVAEMQEHHANLRSHLESEKETKNKALEDLNSFMSQQLGRNLSAQSAPIQERLDYLEKLMGDSAARHARDLAAAHQKIQDHSVQSKGHVQEQLAYQISLASRVEFLEKSLGDSAAKQSQELRDAHQKITDLHGLTEHSERKHSSLQERMDFIENLLGDNVQKHSEELKKTQDRLSELRGKLGVSMRGGEIQVTVESRLKYLEQALGDSDAKHQEELSHAHAKLEALHGRLGHLEVKGELKATLDELKHHCEKQGTGLEYLKSSHANLSSDKSALDLHHARLKERVDYLETMMVDSADHHKKVIEDHKANHAKLANELRAREASHATLSDRMGYIEQRMGDSFEKHAQELAAAVAKMDAVHGRVSEERVAREAHVASLESLKKAHGSLASEKQALEKHHATLEERLDYLEKALGDSSDKHTRELEVLKAAHQKVAAEHKSKEQSHGQVADRLTQLQREKEDLHARHLSLGERVDYLEKLLVESAEKHTQEIEKFKAKHAKDLDASASKMQSHHAGLQERLEYLESKIGDSAAKFTKELSNMHAKMQELHGKLQDEKNHREEKLLHITGHIRDQVSGEQKTREEQHASIEEQVKFLESVIGDNAEKHSKGLEEHGKGVKALSEMHAGTAERLDFIEQTLGVSVEKQAKDLSSFISQQLGGRTTPMQERLDYLEKIMGDSAHQHGPTEHSQMKHSLQERMDFIENMLGDSVQKHSEELKRMQDRVSELRGKLGVGTHGSAHPTDTQVTVESRLKYLEQALGDSEAKHREELKNAHGKLEALHGRLGHLEVKGATVDELKQKCEKQGTALEDLRSSHANLSTRKSSLDSHHANLKERMDFMESMMGDSADNHNKVLQVHKADHAKLSNDLRVHQANHATLADRMGYMEQLMGDSFEKHAKELAAAMAKMDAMHGKVCEERVGREESLRGEAHKTSLESLKKAHGNLASEKQTLEKNHSPLQERLDHLEKGSHATLADRVGYIEQVMGDSFEKHAQELAATAKMDSMRGLAVSHSERVAAVAREAHMASQESLKKAHGSLASQKQALETHHATLERIDYLEKALSDSSEKHSRELEALKAAHQKVLVEHKGKEQSLLQMQRLGERVDYLEKLLAESAEKHQQEFEKFKAKHAKLDAGANKLQSQHAGLQEQLEYLETKICDSAEHAKELSNMQATMQDLHSKLQDEKNSREEKLLHLTGHLREQVSAQKAREERHASMEERLKFLESLLRDSAEHKKALEEHSKGLTALSEKHDRLEKMLGASVHKHAQEEAARLQVEELLRRETQERLKHHETQSELVDSLQRTVAIFDALIRKDMEERKLEMKHIWEAIDGHTHDLSSKVKAIGSDTEDLEGETRLRPRVVARSSPSLPGVVSPSVRSGAGGGNSPNVVTYRPAAVLPASQARIVYPSTVRQAPPAPIALLSTRSELIAAPGRSLSPSRRIDHSEVVCGKARYQGERAHNAEIFMTP